MEIQHTGGKDLSDSDDLSRQPSPPAAKYRWPMADLLTGAVLFIASAAFVLWQNRQLTVLWDLSYILENATRIALGQVPYRDFPFPYAPLTFLMQAGIIKLTGRAVLHHYLYAAAASGTATLLTWRILRRTLDGSALPARLAALLLAAPLVFLGTGGIFPHPFYDCDCTLAVLLGLWLLLRAESRGWPALSTFAAGAALAIPLFVKQNTGLAFLLSAALCIAWIGLQAALRHRAGAGRAALLLFGGAAAGLTFALIAIQSTAGLANYYHWTMRYAASRRLPGVGSMLGVYRDPALLWSYAVAALGLFMVLRGRPRRSRAARWIGCGLLCLPFLWTVAALALRSDDSDRAEVLLQLWPVLLLISVALALWRLPRATVISDTLPLIVLGTIHGAFLSQQLWGSTYALWPLLMILIAALLAKVANSGDDGERRGQHHATREFRHSPSAVAPMLLTIVASLTLLIAGGHYAISHERLSYADLSGGMHHSALPPLRGLAMRGDWLPDFEELVAYSGREIPFRDAILTIPGEDLFYFTTGRTPQFPVVMIDHTVNPYSAEQLAQLARERNVRWVVVKRNLQLQEDPVGFRAKLMELLARDYEQVESLNNYDIYRRKQP